VPITAFLVDASQRPLQRLADPTGATFDAAGDFDALLGERPDLPLWSSIDPYADVTLSTFDMEELLQELQGLRSQGRPHSEQRGLERLIVMAERCRDDHTLKLRFVGD
jgi:hypothetical protein